MVIPMIIVVGQGPTASGTLKEVSVALIETASRYLTGE